MAHVAIRTQGLTKHFGRVVALDGLDPEIYPGEIFGFLGPNGAGKSTTIRLLLGLIRPTAGQAWLAGVPVSDVEQAHRSVSYVPGVAEAVSSPGDKSSNARISSWGSERRTGNSAGGMVLTKRDNIVAPTDSRRL